MEKQRKKMVLAFFAGFSVALSILMIIRCQWEKTAKVLWALADRQSVWGCWWGSGGSGSQGLGAKKWKACCSSVSSSSLLPVPGVEVKAHYWRPLVGVCEHASQFDSSNGTHMSRKETQKRGKLLWPKVQSMIKSCNSLSVEMLVRVLWEEWKTEAPT